MEGYGFELVVKYVHKGHQLSDEFSDDKICWSATAGTPMDCRLWLSINKLETGHIIKSFCQKIYFAPILKNVASSVPRFNMYWVVPRDTVHKPITMLTSRTGNNKLAWLIWCHGEVRGDPGHSLSVLRCKSVLIWVVFVDYIVLFIHEHTIK